MQMKDEWDPLLKKETGAAHFLWTLSNEMINVGMNEAEFKKTSHRRSDYVKFGFTDTGPAR